MLPADLVAATPASPWLTVSEAATFARVGPKTIYSACRSRQLRHVLISRRRKILIKSAWIEDWLARAVVEVKP